MPGQTVVRCVERPRGPVAAGMRAAVEIEVVAASTGVVDETVDIETEHGTISIPLYGRVVRHKHIADAEEGSSGADYGPAGEQMRKVGSTPIM